MDGTDWTVQRIAAFGPNSIGPNVLFNMVEGMESNVWSVLDRLAQKGNGSGGSPVQQTAAAVGSLKEFEGSILFGFNLSNLLLFVFCPRQSLWSKL